MNNTLAPILGFICAGVGGELLVRGIVGVARATRVPPGIVAVTLAASATSSPELAVAISATLAHKRRRAAQSCRGVREHMYGYCRMGA